MATTQSIRKKAHVRRLAAYYLKRGQLRNHLLIVLGLFTALRISDILRLKWEDVYDFERGAVRESLQIMEKKTGKFKLIALNKDVVSALRLFAANNAEKGGFLILNPLSRKAISRIQAYRVIRAAGEALKLESRVSCHSLRKTFGYHAFMYGASSVVLMDIYNHSSFDVTKRYIGVTQDDKDAVYLGLSFA